MQKIISVLFTLALILTLIPVSPAQAAYTCPGCGKTVDTVTEWRHNDNNTHTGLCPDCGAELSGTTEECKGGTGSCTTRPVCDVCHKEYGTTDGPHNWQPWPGHETITRMYFRCANCDAIHWEHNSETWNAKWELVRYANGDHVKYYKAHCTGPDDDCLLTVLPVETAETTDRDETEEIGLYMTPDDVYVWCWEDVHRIEFVRGDATLALDPREVTPAAFGLRDEEAPDYYIFSLTPAEGGWLVKAEALTGTERIPMQDLKGLTLTLGGTETEVTENGVFTA